jgi:hypothetical protein
MATKPVEQIERHRPGRWIKTAVAVAVALIVLAVLAAVVGWHAYAPGAAREQLRSALRESWTGPVRVGPVELGLFGPVRVAHVEMLDDQGRPCAVLSRVTLHVQDFPGTHPIITSINCDGVRIDLYRVNGELTLPPRRCSQKSRLADRVRLTSVALRNVDVTMHDDGQAVREYRWDSLRLTRKRGWSLSADGRTVADHIVLTGPERSAAGESYALSMSTLGGTVDSRVELAEGPAGLAIPGGSLALKDLNMDDVAGALGTSDLGNGLLNGTFDFHADELSLAALRGTGRIEVAGVNAESAPIASQLIEFMNGGDGHEQAGSRVKAVFDVSGPVVTIERGELTDPLRAMSVEKGGTIDLRTGALDLYLVTLQLRGLGGLASSLPVINLAVIFTNKLTRFHVTGTWSDQKITKEPVKDVSSASVDIFREALKTTTGLPTAVIDGLLKMMGGQ